MKFFKTRNGVIVSAVLAFVVIVLATTLGWSHSRFTRISACQACHELFVDYDEYKPVGEVSSSVEDYNPTEQFEAGSFDVTVGCAECHAYPYEEYRDSPHYDNEMDVRPGCVGCHEPHSVREVMAWKFFYINKGVVGESPFHAISNSMRDIPQWEELRVSLAGRVRQQLLENKSAACMNCHKIGSEWFNDIERHQIAKQEGKTCIQCHYNLVHAEVEWDEELHGK